MNLRQLFQTVKIGIRSRLQLAVLASIAFLCCILILPKFAHPAVTPASHSVGFSVERWRSQSLISLNTDKTPESQLQEAQRLQLEGFYRRSAKLLLEVLVEAESDLDFEKLIRDEYSDAEIKEFFPLEPTTQLRSEGLRRLGDVLRTIGALNTSEIILKQSLTLAETQEEQSAIYFSLGNTYRALGKQAQIIAETASEKKQQKADLDRKALVYYNLAIDTSSTESLRLRAKLSKLNLLVEIQPDSEVISLAQDLQATLENLEPNLETVYAHIDLAQSLTCLNVKQTRSEFEYPQPPIVNLCQSDSTERISAIDPENLPKWDDVIQLLVTAERQARDLRDGRSQSYALGNLGEIYEIRQQFDRAKTVTEEAAKLATQSNQLSDILYRWEWQLGRLAWKGKGEQKEIIAAYEATFNSLEELQQNLGSLNADIQFNFRDEVEPAYRQFVDVLLQNEPGTVEPSQDNLKQARDVIEALQIAELNNFFREACLKPKTQEVDRIDRNTAVIYPIILNDRLGVIESRDNKPLRYDTSLLSQLDTEEIVNNIRKELIRESSNLENLQDRLNELYSLIVKPFEQDLELSQPREASRVQTLVFVLDGLFKNLPMSALYDKERDRYLLERYSIAVAPSLKLLDSKGLPFLDRVNTLVAGASDAPSFKAEGREFNKIFNVQREIEKIEQEIQKLQKLVEGDFTKSNFQDLLSTEKFSIVHIATHGKFSSNPEKTFILAWDDAINVREFQSFLQQNPNLSKPIELLVLSACQTAKGDNRSALGLAGIAVRAGARSTLASQWQVDDRSTAKLMVEFYKQLKKSKTQKAEALRQAQLTLLKNIENRPEDIIYKHPYYWSAFTLIGNWR